MADESNSSVAEFSAAETKLLVAMLKHALNDIQTNWEAVATEAGYSNAQSARARWHTIRRKKIAISGGDGASPSAGASGGKKKGVTKASDGGTPTKKRGASQAPNGETPTKKRGRLNKSAAMETEEEPDVTEKAETEGDCFKVKDEPEGMA